jgi:transposase
MTAAERGTLEAYARGHDRRLASRAAAILASADGVSNKDVAARCGMTKQTVGKWRARFRARRMAGLRDDPRPGAPRRINDDQVATVLRLTRQPSPAGTVWTTRSMAQAVGLTQTAISRIWRTHGVKPVAMPANGDGNGRTQPSMVPVRDPSAPRPGADTDTPARARALADMTNLLRDARALRASCPDDLDPLLNLAIDAIERALEKHHEPVRSSYVRTENAVRQARNLLAQAKAAARTAEQLASSVAATTAAVAAIRRQAQRLSPGPPGAAAPRRCPSCGYPYTLRFRVRGAGGDEVRARMNCPRPPCRKPIEVHVPRSAEDVRLEEATAS